jgi:hypothetical protein
MPSQPQDLNTLLRELANRWANLARDYSRDSKSAEPKDPGRAQYLRGIAEGYYKAATDLAAQIKQAEARGAPLPGPDAGPDAGPPRPAAPPMQYTHVPMSEVLRVLSYAGTAPRDVFPRDDGTYTAVFSKWEPLQPHERVAAMQQAEPRLVILGQGKSKDAGDPTVDFAFKPPS